jgi:hypothetical protein
MFASESTRKNFRVCWEFVGIRTGFDKISKRYDRLMRFLRAGSNAS